MSLFLQKNIPKDKELLNYFVFNYMSWQSLCELEYILGVCVCMVVLVVVVLIAFWSHSRCVSSFVMKLHRVCFLWVAVTYAYE